MKNKKSMRKLLTGLLAIVMAACMLMGMATTAAAANQSIVDAKNGVVQIQIWFNDVDMANSVYLARGTGFIINENTVVTCDHVVSFSDEELYEYAQVTSEILGKKRTVSDVKKCLEIRVIVYRDVYVKASVYTNSVEMDYAILNLEKSISGREALKLRDSDTLKQTENVYALGFPAINEDINEVRYFDAEAVTITNGTVIFKGTDTFNYGDGNSHENVNVVISSATIHGGNSGGPLVDNYGNVVGINAYTSSGKEGQNYAVSSKQLITVLDALTVEYTLAPTEPEPPADPVTTEPSTGEITVPSTAEPAPVTTEPTVPTTKEPEPKPEPEGLDPMIIAIAAVAVVVVILLIVLILNSKKKKAAQIAVPVAPAPSVPRAPQPQPPVAAPRAPMAPPAPARPATPETSVLNAGVGETTVLGAGSGETTVLAQNVNGGFLLRTSNNERIPINTADFTVGRERSKVDYCIGGNTNISREHARFVVRNGNTYIIDNKTANGTFVNGVKARPGQEIELKAGDKIVLADESFEFSK